MHNLRRVAARSLWPAIVLASMAVLIAAIAGTILLYDGAWFLFNILDTHRIEIPQLRISFALMQWPAIWAAEATDSLPIVRFVFSIIVMAMPPIAIALCWWIVRKDAPWLIVWPALGIFLVDLPGQIHWIATSIRTNQLLWPILLAVFIGMPDRVVPLVTILLISALFMHPQISVYLIAGACAALFLAWQRPEQRQRLHGTAMVFVFAAIYRYGILSGGYEAEEASISNQIGQWQRSTLWLPLITLVAVLCIAVYLVLRRRGPLQSRNAMLIATGIALVGAVAIVVWAADPTQWRTAIDYRGPSMWHSLILMGIAFLDVVLKVPLQDTTPDTRVRISISNIAAVIFCVVIALQSVGWNGELDKMRTAMAQSEGGCIPAQSLPGFEDSPLNFWSLPAASIGIQSVTPNHVVLPEHLCNTAINTGVIPMNLVDPTRDTPGRFVNMFHLRSQVASVGTCWQAYEAGWHDLERQNNETRRWSSGTGVIILVMDESGQVQLSGLMDSIEMPNEVKIRVNGMIQRSLPIDTERYRPLDDVVLTLNKGPNVIEFVSMRPATTVEGDPRELAVAVVNLEFRATAENELCTWRDDPAARPDASTPATGTSTRPITTPVASPASARPVSATPEAATPVEATPASGD